MIGAVCIVSHEQTQSDIYRTCDIVICTKRLLLGTNNAGADKFSLTRHKVQIFRHNKQTLVDIEILNLFRKSGLGLGFSIPQHQAAT